jgi:TatD DNase family protein
MVVVPLLRRLVSPAKVLHKGPPLVYARRTLADWTVTIFHLSVMLIDSHCHLDFPQLLSDLPALLSRADDAGVGLMVTISTRVARFDALKEIVEAHDNVFCSVGTHPHNAAEEQDVTLDELIEIAGHPKVVAIGEAGLDYHYDYSPRELQAKSFRVHIAAARETGLPLVIHSREADEDMAAILEEESAKGAFPFVLHCFTSGEDLARRGLVLGGYISFSGVVTFKKADSLRRIAASTPADRLLVETDAPYLAPEPFRGKTNEPAYVAKTAERLAAVRGLAIQDFTQLTTDNFFILFRKVPRTALKEHSNAA